MRRLHLVVGFTFAAVFAATGAYMRVGFPELHGGDNVVRMMYRSAHVYILLGALLNLGVASHMPPPTPRCLGRRIASITILLVPMVFTAAFFLEPHPERFERIITQAGLALAAGGTLGHVILSRWPRALDDVD